MVTSIIAVTVVQAKTLSQFTNQADILYNISANAADLYATEQASSGLNTAIANAHAVTAVGAMTFAQAREMIGETEGVLNNTAKFKFFGNNDIT